MDVKENAAPSALDGLQAVLEKLLGPDGCPWDKEQTPESLCEYMLEEAYELADAVRNGSVADVCEEMGDLAFILAFIAHKYQHGASDRGAFNFDDALNAGAAKMTRRHPHVFGDKSFTSYDELGKSWEAIKKQEKAEKNQGDSGIFSSLPVGLPALVKAYRIHSKASRLGFTWESDQDVEQQVEAEWLEFLDALAQGDEARAAREHELGDLIFTLVELGRRKGIKASAALDRTNDRFLRRFKGMETLAGERGLDFAALPLDGKDELWNEVKAAESGREEEADDEAAEEE